MKSSSLLRIWLTKSFKPFVFNDRNNLRLDFEKIDPLGLYIHIPFCRTICSFCPYCKIPYQKELADQYIKALLEEIRMVGQSGYSAQTKKRVVSLYFGGGSPELLVDSFKEIVDTVSEYFVITGGIGVEIHPDHVDIEMLRKLKDAEVTMISIGVQSFHDESLRQLGRKPFDRRRLFDALAQVPFESVSMDLIFALTGQTFDYLKDDIDTAFQNGANQVAIYPFIEFDFFNDRNEPKKGSFPIRGKTRSGTGAPMSEKEKRKLLDQITEYCRERNYDRTSIWTFAQKGARRYSSMTRDNFLGFGCSAATLLKDQFKINTFSVPDYIDRIEKKRLPTSLTVQFTLKQRMVYYLFWKMYTTVLDAESFRKFFGRSIYRHFGLTLLAAQGLGLLRKKGRQWQLTDRGAYYFHYFEQFYTLAYIEKMWTVSQNVPFPEKIILD